jgi:hypothetical protein
MQILSAQITITDNKFSLAMTDREGKITNVGDGTLSTYQISKSVFKTGDYVMYKPGKSPYIIAPSETFGVAVGTIAEMNHADNGNVKITLSQDGGFAKLTFSPKLPVRGGDLEIGVQIKAVGSVSAYKSDTMNNPYVSIWCSSVDVMESAF